MIRLYFKIVKTQYKMIMIYTGIFLAFFTLYASLQKFNKTTQVYENVKSNISVIDEDQSELSKSFLAYLSEKTVIQDIDQEEEAVKDALFYDMIDYAIVIPKNFEADFLAGKSSLLETQKRPDNTNASAVEMYIDSYLNQMYTYHQMTSMPIKESHEQIMQQMEDTLEVHMQIKTDESAKYNFRNNYFNYFSYIMMSLTIMVVGMTMLSIFRNDVYKRNLIAPISNSSMNLQLLLANVMLASGLWVILSSVCVIFSLDTMLSLSGLLHLCNSYIFTIICASLTYLICCLLVDKARSRDMLNGICNTLTLAASFLCGAFVPQQMLSTSILQFSSFFPTYWYIKANNIMNTGDVLLTSDYVEVIKCIGIEALFGVAFLFLALAIMRNKRSQEAFLAPSEQGNA